MKETNFGKGAVIQKPDTSIGKANIIGGDSAPFDWSLAFDIEDRVGKIPVKNQFTSYSCGGQASAYLMAVLDALRDGALVEKSAKFIYSPVAVPGGGSSEGSLTNRILNFGSADESIVPSYKTDKTTDEAFMTGPVDSLAASDNAMENKGRIPLYFNVTIEDIAKAVRDNGGVIIGVRGVNNGTWLSENPQPPKGINGEFWGHWLYVGRAKTIDGKKKIGVLNSWGESAGKKGWQWLDESYIPYIWAVWGMVIQDKPTTTYLFKNDLHIGSNGPEVSKLQMRLQALGYFPKEQLITNYYGPITKQAVIAYQKANKLPTTGYFGPLTRESLNKK